MAFPAFVLVIQLDEVDSDKMHGARRYYTAVGAVEGDSLPDLLWKAERVEGDTIVEVGRSRVM